MRNKKSYQVELEWEGNNKSIVNIRNFTISIDNPHDKGGENSGPMPTEVLLAALGGCIAIGIVYFANKMRVNLINLQLKIKGSKDEVEDSRINHIDIFVYPEIEEIDNKKLKRLIELAERYCTIGNTLKNETKISIHTERKNLN